MMSMGDEFGNDEPDYLYEYKSGRMPVSVGIGVKGQHVRYGKLNGSDAFIN